MKTLIREMLSNQLQALLPIFDAYTKKQPFFVPKGLQWLAETEQALARHRHRLASFIATQRGQMQAVADGYRETTINLETKSNSKRINMYLFHVLQTAEANLRNEIEHLDEEIRPLRIQMAQLLSIASTQSPIAVCHPEIELRQKWLQTVWANLALNEQTRPAYAYLNTMLSLTDRLFLLDELLNNLLTHSQI